MFHQYLHWAWCLYAKFKPETDGPLQELQPKSSILKLLRACERLKTWEEAVLLYIKYDELDDAIISRMDQPPATWNQELFTANIQKATNQDLLYKAMIFYLEEQQM